MALVSGLGTTYNLPNYHGELMNVSPQDTPFTTAIGGIGTGMRTDSVAYEWQFEDLRAASATRQRLEGADAPSAEERTRFPASNVVEVHQEAVAVSYTKLAATGNFNGANIGGAATAMTPTLNEFDHQIDLAIRAKKRDVEATCLIGTKNVPVDNTTARRTGGLLEAAVTNVIVKAAAPALTEKDVLDLMQSAYDNGGIAEEETRVLIVPAVQKRWVTKRFIADKGYQETSRNIGGVTAMEIETDFGKLSVMLNRYMPADTVAIASLEDCELVFLEIPRKGVLFVEQLAKTGAQEKAQLYGEIGLKWGNERKHGKITGLGTVAPA